MWKCKKCSNEIYFDSEPSICYLDENMQLDTSNVDARCSVCDSSVIIKNGSTDLINEIAEWV